METTAAILADGGQGGTVRVRGLRAGHPVPVRHCRHCGSSLSAAGRESGFCCPGCAYVHRLVGEHRLEGYYRIRDAVVAPVGDLVFQPRDYAWLRELQGTAESGVAIPELTLGLQGISCAGCVWLVEKIFGEQAGALAIEVNAPLGRLRLRWARGKFDLPAFARTLQSFNYLVGPADEEPVVSESRALVRRIGLCAALALNVMLFTLPAYFGMESSFPYARLFGTLAMGFATLSVLAGGSYFLRRAVRALAEGAMHLDLPIAVGFLGAYAGSLYGWATGRPALVYFDFVATFIVLMLVGRWAQVAAVENNRRRLLAVRVRPEKVSVMQPDGTTRRQLAESLATGSVFEVVPGQVVPVEAQMESAAGVLGTAWISGEADPRPCRLGARVPAGAVNLGREVLRLRAVQPWAGSLLAQLLRPAELQSYREPLLEKIVSGYLAAILAGGAVTGLVWWLATHDVVRAWSALTAVLVVSCPCGIGLALPLVDERATLSARKAGVFVRRDDLWARLGRLRKIIFDKTGTLTLEAPVLQNPERLAALAGEARAALFALTRDNAHPISLSLHENLLAGNLVPDGAGCGPVTEEPGLGVKLTAGARIWSLGRAGWRAGNDPGVRKGAGPDDAATEFAVDGSVLARFEFAESARPGAREELAWLRGRSFTLTILSGDAAGKVGAIARDLGLPAPQAFSGFSPAQKEDWVRQFDRRDTLMLGDGANDSLAFDAAFVRGTPVIHRGVLEAKADFYYLGRSLAGLRRLFEINAVRIRTRRRLLTFSVAYNVVAVVLAAAGWINPLAAAVLMPASSLATVAIVAAGMRRA